MRQALTDCSLSLSLSLLNISELFWSRIKHQLFSIGARYSSTHYELLQLHMDGRQKKKEKKDGQNSRNKEMKTRRTSMDLGALPSHIL